MRSDDDLLGDNNGRHKTYVHRRNKRLSTVLNIIMLGSVITAVGVAIGHMWGVRDDCTIQATAPSVNKILSNLYKLQEENNYLRNKLKELTLLNNVHMSRKLSAEKSIKQTRCKKMFEEPLSNQNTNKVTKCLDNEETNADKLSTKEQTQPEYEKELLRDVDKLKNVYMQNKSWLDEAIARRLKNEKQQAIKDMKGLRNILKDNVADIKQKPEKPDESVDIKHHIESEIKEDAVTDKNSAPAKKITYADSLRSDKDNKTKQTVNLEPIETKHDYRRKRPKRSFDTPVENSFSEEDFKKDDRYMAPKHKQERKKYDRHNLHKKQKRKNKYEQWEIKSGYMKDFDDLSISSSQENDFILKNPDNNAPTRDFERNAFLTDFSDTTDNVKSTQTLDRLTRKTLKQDKTRRKDKDPTWYEKRAIQRTEARKKLEQELFGDSSPNTAGWYFKRMQKREQCRVKGDNSTHRKLLKRSMNFKLKR